MPRDQRASKTPNKSISKGGSNQTPLNKSATKTDKRRTPAKSSKGSRTSDSTVGVNRRSLNTSLESPYPQREVKLSKINRNRIVKLQSTTNLLIPRSVFTRVVREISQNMGDFRFQSLAILALQESAEQFITKLFNKSDRLSGHAKRVTLRPVDIKLYIHMLQDHIPGLAADY